jgi:hypothetical protein
MNAPKTAEWLAEEHRKVVDLMERLRAKSTVPQPQERGPWLEEVRRRFEHLRAHMIKQFALEEDGGYLVPVLECRPTLSKQVEALRHEHAEIIEILNTIHDALHRAEPVDGLLIRDTWSRIRNLLGYIEDHDQNEYKLVTSVFTVDMGGKD